MKRELAICGLVISCSVPVCAGDLASELNGQMMRCYRLPGQEKVSLPPVTVKFELKEDGSLASGPDVFNPQKGKEFSIAAKAAVEAVKGCAPYKLPRDQYKEWSKVTWEFDADVVRGMKAGRSATSIECDESDPADLPGSKEEFIEAVRSDAQQRARFVTSPRKASVVVRVKLNNAGIVQERSVVTTSGNKEVDDLALSLTIERFAPFGLGMMAADPQEVDIPITFEGGMIASKAELEKKEVEAGRAAVRQAAMSAYLTRVRKLITREKTVVPGWKAPVTASFRIDKEGKGSCGKILVSAGNPLADQQAIDLVTSLKYPPFVTEMEMEQFTTYVTIDFSQRNPRKFDK